MGDNLYSDIICSSGAGKWDIIQKIKWYIFIFQMCDGVFLFMQIILIKTVLFLLAKKTDTDRILCFVTETYSMLFLLKK